jgi:hypothetical protein
LPGSSAPRGAVPTFSGPAVEGGPSCHCELAIVTV